MTDPWSEWILKRRHGDDEAVLRATLDRVRPIRDRVIANARLVPGDHLLDVGCGDGLIGFGAIDLHAPDCRVTFSDISNTLVARAQETAAELDVLSFCSFLVASADDLSGVADSSVDVVTTRSVLAYVSDKAAAFREFARVLRQGGRFSIYEPINRHIAIEAPGQFFGYDIRPLETLALRVNEVYERRQPIATDPMFDFDERDLLRFAADAGFSERHLTFDMHVLPAQPDYWDRFAHSAQNPLAPTLTEAMHEVLSAAEIAAFIEVLKPKVEEGAGTTATAVAYLWGALPE